MLTLDVAAKSFQAVAFERPQTRPLDCFIVKIFQVCNINCRYCYMYNLEDSSFVNRPKIMPKAVFEAFVERVKQHVEEHDLTRVTCVLHGGEPLLAGPDYIAFCAATLHKALGGRCTVDIALQTNGILLDADWAALLQDNAVRIGVSLDGPKPYHDALRVDHRGAGSFERATAGLKRYLASGRSPAGASILSVANTAIAPEEMWDFWMGTGVKRFDFLLPHHTHDNPPTPSQGTLSRWMTELFDLWWACEDPEVEIRYFANIVNLLHGADFSMDYLGGRPMGLVVVESDGAITGFDSLRACENGLVETGLTVQGAGFDLVLSHPIARLCNHSRAFLARTCVECPVRDVCGGGFITHRYSRKGGFNNPSVYCESLRALISHIERLIDAEPDRPRRWANPYLQSLYQARDPNLDGARL